MFFNYLVRKDVCQDNPLKDIPLLAEERFIPLIFSPAQIDRLLEALAAACAGSPPILSRSWASIYRFRRPAAVCVSTNPCG